MFTIHFWTIDEATSFDQVILKKTVIKNGGNKSLGGRKSIARMLKDAKWAKVRTKIKNAIEHLLPSLHLIEKCVLFKIYVYNLISQ